MVVVSLLKKSDLEDTLRLDPEYYDPKHINKERELSALITSTLEDLCLVTDGNHMSISEHFQNTGYRYLRGQDLSHFFISDKNPVYIPEDQFRKLEGRSHIEHFDVLVSIVGTIGRIAFITDDWEPLTANCKIAILRVKSSDKTDPHFLAAFLLCKYGQFQLKRKVRGAVQTGVTLEDLRNVRIPILDEKFRKQVQVIIIQAQNAFRESRRLYQKALKELSEKIGIDKLFPEGKLYYISNLSDAQNAHRMDAEYFHPKYNIIFETVRKETEVKKLDNLVTMKKGIEPGSEAYRDEGIPFVRVSNLGIHEITNDNQAYLEPDLYEELRSKYQPEVGEILLSKDATPGIAFFVREDQKMIISSGIMRLRSKTDINIGYLSLVLNSPFTNVQIEKATGGSVINHWKPSEIKKTLIPVLDEEKRNKLGQLLEQSYLKRREMKQVFQEAKQIVERRIESTSSSKLH